MNKCQLFISTQSIPQQVSRTFMFTFLFCHKYEIPQYQNIWKHFDWLAYFITLAIVFWLKFNDLVLQGRTVSCTSVLSIVSRVEPSSTISAPSTSSRTSGPGTGSCGGWHYYAISNKKLSYLSSTLQLCIKGIININKYILYCRYPVFAFVHLFQI
jgi:hypothetical protein